jgi:hypothetical protein
MARTGLNDIRSLPDPFFGYNFDLIIPNVPGGGDARSLTIKCMSTSLPGKSTEDTTVSLHGVDVKYAGREMYTHTLSVVYLETRDLGTHRAISAWLDLQRNARNNTGSYKTEYATEANLQLYDDTGAVIQTIKLDGFFPQNMDDSALDGSNSTPVNIAVTFVYDTWYTA